MLKRSCDLLENSYLCGISNNSSIGRVSFVIVVICLKIRTFVVSATTPSSRYCSYIVLWFAWKFVPLWYQQQLEKKWYKYRSSCDLLENSYLCGISNNGYKWEVIDTLLWFAWKFVPLWYQQQPAWPRAPEKLSCDLLENSYLCGISNNWFDFVHKFH